ncbi:MAG: excinuclease ABC subunit UvrA [Candidatus Melainabacteria bacterium]|nr:excinuclease ABC subunit UvrA [Candidatus Melainabacteria bacterium]
MSKCLQGTIENNQKAELEVREQYQNDQIQVIGARQHNLKNLNVNIPKNKLVVITGVSGSGKSSLAFDTIFAEGQRRYIESLSSYARQFLGQLDKPDVEEIKGLSPAIAIDQKSTSHNPRSTVGTVTEVYDYLRLLFSRTGTPHCPVCDTKIEAQTIDQIIDSIMLLEEGRKILVLAPLLQGKKGEHQNLFSSLKADGFMRIRINGTLYTLEEAIKLDKNKKHDIDLVVDRIVIKDSARSRIADSVSLALNKGEGKVIIQELFDGESSKDHLFSELYSCPNGHGSIPELDPKLFSFNTPHGACSHCSGLGVEFDFSAELIIPNDELSLKEGAIAPWAKTNNVYYEALLEGLSKKLGFSINKKFKDLSEDKQHIILHGLENDLITINTDKYPSLGYANYQTHYEGVIPQLERRYKDTNSDSWKADIEKFMIERPCPECQGSRLRAEARSVKVAKKSIHELCELSIEDLYTFFEQISNKLTETQKLIAEKLLHEIKVRLKFLIDVGLEYLSLARTAKTLSGGEAQRIRLASQIGSGLSGVLYVLDEPSIGLHQRDNARLLKTLRHLRDLGNTVLVVEHDEDTMRHADWIIDIGLGAGVHGGTLIAEGKFEDILNNSESLTAAYLSRRKQIPVPNKYRNGNGHMITLDGAKANNLQNLSLDLPLGKFIAVTGVSGSGKSTLINELLLPAVQNKLKLKVAFPNNIQGIQGVENIDKVIVIDQSPIGRTPRSNPSTYTGAFDPIRELFSQTIEAKARGYSQGRFSFNVKGGRCEACSGAGLIEIEMNFLPSVFINCEVCKGRRYNKETLEVKYKGKSIYDVLEMTVETAVEFFEAIPKIKNKLQTLHDVGLDYIKLGQSATTLSGGEAQRVKLANELAKRSTGKTLYLLDEPTTGLHWHDIELLLLVLNRLVDSGNTVLVIEHNLDVIRQCDHIIDLGPEGGAKGGQIVKIGTPKQFVKDTDTHTAKFLAMMD